MEKSSKLKQGLLKSNLVVGIQLYMLRLLVMNILWDIVFEKRPDLVSKGEFFGCKGYMHIDSSSCRGRAQNHAG